MGTHVPGIRYRAVLLALALLFGLVPAVVAVGVETPSAAADAAVRAKVDRINASRVTQADREAAADRLNAQQDAVKASVGGKTGAASTAAPPPGPGGVPDMFGSVPNWAYTPIIRKFVDGLPGLGAANHNELGQYLSIAHPDTITYPGSDYYEIELREYSEKMHSDLPATRLRGYVQVNEGTDASGHNTIQPDAIHYLGPTIFATKNRPVRVKFTNKLPIDEGGDLFIPVDTSVMGAGTGPTGEMYTQNRATLHLHGGVTPWISDGTPHQWITPAGENATYPVGVSVKNVPDMPDPGDGSMTFFYSNQQSARMLWIHDHSYGITRLNVYAGEAQAYMLTDDTEKKLITDGTIPSDQIPLVIQDKTFVDASTILDTDPTWNWGTTAPTPHTGDLWVPHVYVPAQNPADIGGMNATGRWHYGPWFWPPVTDIQHPPIPNPYYDPINAPWEPALMPATPNPSMGMEAYNDTPLVNGTPYPVLEVDPKSYRFRILNAANDRFFNLQMYVADPTVVTSDGRHNTEVKMIPASATPGAPELWPTDGRFGGVPDFNTAGPQWIQIASESGFLPAPAIIPQQPITWNTDPTTFNMGNVQDHSLLLGTAERADVIVDFSQYAGQTLILYNDAPTAFPALDQRTDYFTGNADMTDTGGTKATLPGFGPNTRTIMQIKVAAKPPAQEFDLAALQAAFASTGTQPGVFAKSQKPILVPDARYGSAYNVTTFTADPYVRIYQTEMTFKTLAGATVTIPLEPKAIQDEQGETFDEYGRMSAKLGLEMPQTNATNANFLLFNFIDPPTENIQDASMTPMSPIGEDGTQIWKITHNGVDTHPVHFHLFDVQLINRVGWDGAIRVPDDNELGWKDTIRISPLEDTIVALRAEAPKLKFGVPDSVRPLNPAEPLGSDMGFAPVGPDGQPVSTVNVMYDFGWEYVWHCHILSHEEMDMMRAVSVTVARSLPTSPTLAATGTPGGPIDLRWVDPTPVNDPTTPGNPANEIGFRVERAEVSSLSVETSFSTVATALANVTTYQDDTTLLGQGYLYRVVAYNAAGEVVSNVVRVTPPGYFAELFITPYANVGGTITPNTVQTVALGADSTTFTIAPDVGYHLVDVMVDGVSMGLLTEYTFVNVQTDHTIWAIFGQDSFTITPTAGANGTINPDVPTDVPAGNDSPAFVILPNLGYHVADVLVDGVSVGAVNTYTFTNVMANHTIHATFAVNTYTITPSAGAGGAIVPGTAQTVSYGANQSFAINPNTGYHIVDVTVDGTSVGVVTSYNFTNVTANHTIAATFAIDAFTITPTAGANGTITPSTPQPVDFGGTVSFAITPNSGYHVADVLVDGVSVGALTTYDFTNVQANHTIEASFAINSFVITPTAGLGGTISPATTQTLFYGGSALFTITPNAGFYIADVLVDGGSVGPVASYTFTNVTASHTIAATFASKTMVRVSGSDRYSLALAAASRAYPGWAGVTDVVVVGGDDKYITDAVGAAGLAGAFDGPLLVVQRTTLSTQMRNAIAGLPAGVRVHIVGSTSAVSTTVLRQIRGLANVGWVERVAGADRYETAVVVARRMRDALGGTLPNTVLLVNGNKTAGAYDAMVASAVSNKQHFPVLLVKDTSVPLVTASALFDLGLTERYVLGGTPMVNEAVRMALGVAPENRISGPDRYATAAAMATKARAAGWLSGSTIAVVGAYPISAVSASAMIGHQNGVLLYVAATSVPVNTQTYLTATKADITGGFVVGTTSAVSEAVRLQILALIQ